MGRGIASRPRTCNRQRAGGSLRATGVVQSAASSGTAFRGLRKADDLAILEAAKDAVVIEEVRVK
jgi:hypothetical protein